MRQDYDMLKQKFYSKDAPIPRQSTILKNHGVRFSAFDWIPGWRPSRQTALDFMHCIYLGIISSFFNLAYLTSITFRCCCVLLDKGTFCRSHVSWGEWGQFRKTALWRCNKLNPMAVTHNSIPKKCTFSVLNVISLLINSTARREPVPEESRWMAPSSYRYASLTMDCLARSRWHYSWHRACCIPEWTHHHNTFPSSSLSLQSCPFPLCCCPTSCHKEEFGGPGKCWPNLLRSLLSGLTRSWCRTYGKPSSCHALFVDDQNLWSRLLLVAVRFWTVQRLTRKGEK